MIPSGKIVGTCTSCGAVVRERYAAAGRHVAILRPEPLPGAEPQPCGGAIREPGAPCKCGRPVEILAAGERCAGCGDDLPGCACDPVGGECRCGNLILVSVEFSTLAVCGSCVKPPVECTCRMLDTEATT